MKIYIRYHNKIFDIPNKKGNNKSLRYIVYADAEELLNKILEERSEDGNVLVKVMADGGQGFFKFCFTVIPENYPDELNESHDVFLSKREVNIKMVAHFPNYQN